MYVHNTASYMDALPNIVEAYNNSPHRSLRGYSPNEVFRSPALLQTIRHSNAMHNHSHMLSQLHLALRPGTLVRVMKPKQAFAKESTTFSKELYTVVTKHWHKYTVADARSGKELPRKLKRIELLPVPPTMLAAAPDNQLDVVEQERKRQRVVRHLTHNQHLDRQQVEVALDRQQQQQQQQQQQAVQQDAEEPLRRSTRTRKRRLPYST
jgi:transcription initiation factor TFIID subunit TAF12